MFVTVLLVLKVLRVQLVLKVQLVHREFKELMVLWLKLLWKPQVQIVQQVDKNSNSVRTQTITELLTLPKLMPL